jgi:hypothetical protein
MFHFGLFSTFIPYLIFAISYIGLLGYNAIQNDKALDYTYTTTQVKLKTNEYNQLNSIHFYQENYTKTTSKNIFSDFLFFLNSHSCYQVIDNVGKLKKLPYFQSIFSRPPPVIIS